MESVWYVILLPMLGAKCITNEMPMYSSITWLQLNAEMQGVNLYQYLNKNTSKQVDYLTYLLTCLIVQPLVKVYNEIQLQ